VAGIPRTPTRYMVLAAAALLTGLCDGTGHLPDRTFQRSQATGHAFVADPCGLLSEADRTELGLPTATNDSASYSPHTGPVDGKPLEFLRIQVMDDRGLTDIQAQCAPHGVPNDWRRTMRLVVSSVAYSGSPSRRPRGAPPLSTRRQSRPPRSPKEPRKIGRRLRCAGPASG
jgi:hypothetical protein